MGYRDDVNEFNREGRWTFFEVLFKLLLPISAVLIILGAICWGLGLFGGLVDRVVNPNAIVQNYEWYQQQLKDINAIEGQIKDAQDSADTYKKDNGDPANWKFDQREEYGRLNSNVTGLKQSRRKMIEDYNAKASMITRNLWKSSTCPQHIDE
jgi:hypothetical protein